MPRPQLRTRSKKRRHIRLPGGRTETHYGRGKTASPSCSRCGRTLPGVPRSVPSRIRKLPGSRKAPERIYGGHLCPSCLRELLKEAVRGA